MVAFAGFAALVTLAVFAAVGAFAVFAAVATFAFVFTFGRGRAAAAGTLAFAVGRAGAAIRTFAVHAAGFAVFAEAGAGVAAVAGFAGGGTVMVTFMAATLAARVAFTEGGVATGQLLIEGICRAVRGGHGKTEGEEKYEDGSQDGVLRRDSVHEIAPSLRIVRA